MAVQYIHGTCHTTCSCHAPQPADCTNAHAAGCICTPVLQVGSVVTGVVVDVARDCASVALDGITGTLHKSRMELDKVDDVREKLSIGDYVVVEVLKLDLGKRRASVSMKALGSSTGEMQVSTISHT
jgi:ribosomal protein S1